VTVVLRAFLDAHVHLALIDPARLADGGIGRALDLGGWWPTDGAGLAGGAGPADPAGPETHFAGQFLGAPGGYPSRQAWAPPGSACAVASPTDAADAVGRQALAGAAVIKVTLNSAAGPVLDARTLEAIVAAAHERMLPVAAHAEGPGQAAAAFMAGVDLFAHTPFSEPLPDALLGRMARTMTWISTLDIHGWGEPTAAFSVASDNLTRFHAAGGRVLYGTDLGNGPLPVGLNRREIEALLACGLTPAHVLAALTADVPGYPAAPAPEAPGPESAAGIRPAERRVTVVPGERPDDPRDLTGFTDWLLGARSRPDRPQPDRPQHDRPQHDRSKPAHTLPRPDLEDSR